MEKDVTFVVQGPIIHEHIGRHGAIHSTAECLLSIRKHFPKSTIILSTWEGEDVYGLSYDKLIMNGDPGALEFGSGTTNVNRLIHSTARGIAEAETTWVCKTRTDIFFENNNILNTYCALSSQYPIVQDSVFDSRVLVHEKLSKNDTFLKSHSYYLSDMFIFGKTKDLKKLFSVPFADKAAFEKSYCHNEVYIWSSVSNQDYKSFIANELFICNSKQLGTLTPLDGRYFYSKCLTISPTEWEFLYYSYVKNKSWPRVAFLMSSILKRLALEFFPTKIMQNWKNLFALPLLKNILINSLTYR